MSYIHFLAQGANSPKLDKYHRENYDADTVESAETSHKFDGDIQVIDTDSNDEKTVLMDDAVKITTVADDVRNKAKSFWSQAHKGAMITFTATLIGGIAGITAAIVVGVLLPALWPVALAVGLVSLGILGFSFFNLYRANEAKGQKQWDDPIPHLQQQRQNAGKVGNEGFHYSYQEKLKNQIVSPEELKALWHRGMEYFADRFGASSIADASIVRKFMEQAPVEDGPFTYTFSQISEDSLTASPEEKLLESLSGQFADMKAQYDETRKESERLETLIRQEKTSRIEENDKQRDDTIEPYKNCYRASKSPLQCEIDDLRREISNARIDILVLRNNGEQNPSRVACLNRQISGAECHISRIESELSLIKMDYMRATEPIRERHNQKEFEIKAWASAELDDIRANEDRTLLESHHQPIKGLLDRYTHRNDESKGID